MLLLQLAVYGTAHPDRGVRHNIFSYISSRQNIHTVMLSAANHLIDAIRNRFFVSLRMTAMVNLLPFFLHRILLSAPR